MTDCPLYLDDREIGRLRWSKEGGSVMLWASCPFEKDYIYRLYVGDASDDRRLYVGIMMPERGRFIISKKLPQSKCLFLFENQSLSACIDRRMPGEEESTPPLPMAFSALKPLKGQDTGCGRFIEDIFERGGGLFASHKGIGYFVAPWEPGQELIPACFFCIITYFRYRNQGYCVLCVDSEGKLFSIG